MEHISAELIKVVDAAVLKLRTMDVSFVTQRKTEGKWSMQETLGHLIDSASNNHQRFVRAQRTDELVSPSYDGDAWVHDQCYNEESWKNLVELWRLYNLHLAHVILCIPKEKRNVICRIGDHEPMSLQVLAQSYLDHMKGHLQKMGV